MTVSTIPRCSLFYGEKPGCYCLSLLGIVVFVWAVDYAATRPNHVCQDRPRSAVHVAFVGFSQTLFTTLLTLPPDIRQGGCLLSSGQAIKQQARQYTEVQISCSL
jgi:hypothetical protein